MSILKVNTIQDKGGNNLLVSDGAGTISSGGAITNTPAFLAKRTSNQGSISNLTYTKIQYDVEVYDTDNCYDNSTNFRFTPNQAGKYFVYARALVAETSFTVNDFKSSYFSIYKNGARWSDYEWEFNNSYIRYMTTSTSATIDMNGSTDYLEIYVHNGTVSTNNTLVYANASREYSIFGAYRLIGA